MADDHDQSAHSWRALITGHTAAGRRGSDAARFVTSYYKSCMEIATSRPSFVRSLASALVKIAWKSAEVFKSGEAFAYMVTASVVYKLPSVVHVSLNVLRATMYLKINLACKKGTQDFDALAPVLDALSANLNVTTTADALRQYALNLCSRLRASRRRRRWYAMANESIAFDRQVWNIDDVMAGLDGCGFSLYNATTVEVQGSGEIRKLYSAFAANEDREATAKTVAYLVWRSVVSGSVDFYRSYDGTAPSVYTVCMASLHFISEIHHTFAAAQFTSPEKDVEAQRIFARVKNSVYADCQRYSLIDARDSELSESFFKNLQVVAYGELAESAVPLPSAADNFGENLLRGRAYGFEVVKRRQLGLAGATVSRYGHVEFSGDKWLRLSSVVYRYVSADSSERSSLPSYAYVGRIMAETLWYVLLTHVSWSRRTVANMDNFKRCFLQSYPGSDRPSAPFSLTIATLGLVSTLNALNVTDWYTLVTVGDRWRVSTAQFFYVLATFYKCPPSGTPGLLRTIKASLRYVDDFADAFHCPKSGALTKTRQCVLKLRRQR
ncbi:hypothetical protein HPB50_006455 [Hyalomma asiaticum]|uniref:Uncharacterized protein n=1 Tax=Hyalomma asiaticum TaxID=266040 RepID=A0ACB7RI04_HYAAI|nr:hypothetical protein HPB50_006455 [Hyalomma asiaticum]